MCNTTKINPIYYTDGYPTDNCIVSIQIPEKGETGRCWGVHIYPPNCKEYLESYVASSLKGALVVAQCLIEGNPVPRHYEKI